MTINIFHGDNQASSRALLTAQLDLSKNRGVEIITLDGDKITPADLETALSTSNLFAPTAILIENLLSRLRSHAKDDCMTLLARYQGDKDIYLWERKEVTKLTLNKLPQAVVKLSKTPALIFNFLDALYPGNATRALELFRELCATGYEPIVAMTLIARHISSLIQIVDGTTPKLAPFQITKLKNIARYWKLSQLIEFHDQLLQIDYSIKSGHSSLSYADHLDILLLSTLR